MRRLDSGSSATWRREIVDSPSSAMTRRSAFSQRHERVRTGFVHPLSAEFHGARQLSREHRFPGHHDIERDAKRDVTCCLIRCVRGCSQRIAHNCLRGHLPIRHTIQDQTCGAAVVAAAGASPSWPAVHRHALDYRFPGPFVEFRVVVGIVDEVITSSASRGESVSDRWQPAVTPGGLPSRRFVSSLIARSLTRWATRNA